MKFVELKKSLKVNVEPVYLLYGDDRMVIDTAILHIKESVSGEDDFDTQEFSGKVTAEDVKESVNTLPILASKRLTILKDCDAKFVKNELGGYVKSPNETSVFVITSAEDFALEGATKVDCNRLEKPLLMAKVKKDLKAKNVEIDDDALSTLVDYCDNDLGRITLESFKLASYKKVSLKDVEDGTSKSQNYNVFALTEALGKKDAVSAIRVLDYLLTEDNGKGVISTIYNHFHRLFYIALNPTQRDEEVAQQLGIKSYAVKMSRPQVRYFGVKRLKQILDLVREADYKTKTSFASVESYSYYLVLEILNS